MRCIFRAAVCDGATATLERRRARRGTHTRSAGPPARRAVGCAQRRRRARRHGAVSPRRLLAALANTGAVGGNLAPLPPACPRSRAALLCPSPSPAPRGTPAASGPGRPASSCRRRHAPAGRTSPRAACRPAPPWARPRWARPSTAAPCGDAAQTRQHTSPTAGWTTRLRRASRNAEATQQSRNTHARGGTPDQRKTRPIFLGHIFVFLPLLFRFRVPKLPSGILSQRPSSAGTLPVLATLRAFDRRRAVAALLCMTVRLVATPSLLTAEVEAASAASPPRLHRSVSAVLRPVPRAPRLSGSSPTPSLRRSCLPDPLEVLRRRFTRRAPPGRIARRGGDARAHLTTPRHRPGTGCGRRRGRTWCVWLGAAGGWPPPSAPLPDRDRRGRTRGTAGWACAAAPRRGWVRPLAPLTARFAPPTPDDVALRDPSPRRSRPPAAGRAGVRGGICVEGGVAAVPRAG